MDSENKKIETSVDNLINPEDLNNMPKTPVRIINIKNDGIVERENSNVMTNDGRALLKDGLL